ncbi:DinB superfamily protein [Ekhidna lutea]|uniref:DinB superfamily protein n=1 Tax=Ekhidna lutea TaxID=447679 RepID=A0A239KDT0_EKHLU|nr:DinB family protein [Ekhidna lutea]SNT16507.1 DinB superfamily protein [Ekhidna lutea]
MKKTINEKLKRLEADQEKMFRSIEGISEEKLSDQSYGWSIIQVMSHLNDAETASLKYMQKKVQAGDKMQDSGIGNAFRMRLTNMALKSSLKWKAPSYISNPPAYPLNEMKSKWAETRKAIQQFVDEYPEQWMDKLVYKHPMGGRQNLERAVDSFIYHQIHHLHQIKRIKKQLGL